MRIGILTLPLHTNYGGILQAYALQTVLERMGHDVVVFDKKKVYCLPIWKKTLTYTKRTIKKFILRKKDIRIFEEKYKQKTYPIISQHTQKFIDKYIHLYDVKSFKDIKEDEFDTIVVGSDQIWRARYTRNLIGSVQDTFLSFTKGWSHLKRIAYAASFGTDNWEYTDKETNDSKVLLQRFNAVSVREKNAIQLCKKKLDRMDAVHVIDPTLLLQCEEYKQLFLDKTTKSQGNMLCYVLDTNPIIDKAIKDISKSQQLTPFFVGAQTNNSKLSIKERTQQPLEQWLQGFYDANLIITDSFHACVFSIIFRKPFFVVGNKTRGMSRFESLLSDFGLQDRMIDKDSLSDIDLSRTIDYDKVYAILNKKRDDSIKFLTNSLK